MNRFFAYVRGLVLHQVYPAGGFCGLHVSRTGDDLCNEAADIVMAGNQIKTDKTGTVERLTSWFAKSFGTEMNKTVPVAYI